MARGEIPLAVTRTVGTVSGSSVPVAISGASVAINIRGQGPATIYAAETGNTTLANPLTTGVDGRIDGWLDEGSYDLVISGSGITTYTQPLEIISGKTILSFPGDRIQANTIQGTSLAANTVTGGKVAQSTITPFNLSNSVLPLGTVISWWRPNSSYALPTGWAVADGSVVTSPNHDFGTGSSITLPNLVDKFVQGVSPSAAYGGAGANGAGAGVAGTGGANITNLSHSHTINDHYHIAQGAMGAWSGNLITDDHLHSVGSLYVPSHGHHYAAYTSGAVNFTGSRAQGSFTGVSDTHQHYVESDTWGSGNFGVGGTTGASDRGLYTRGNTSGVSDRGTNAQLSATYDNRPAWVGLIYLIKIKVSAT